MSPAVRAARSGCWTSPAATEPSGRCCVTTSPWRRSTPGTASGAGGRADARRHWEADAAFFAARRAARREASEAFEIGGADIAGVALEYAAALGFLDRTFHENLVEQAPSEALARFLQGVDVVVESGALGDLPPTAFERILDACVGARPPWFIYCPRPDVDWTPLDALWAARGYRTESLGTEPIRYRKALAAQERADMFRVTRELGVRDEDVMRDGYLLVDMTLARPEADAGNLPIDRLRGSYGPSGDRVE